MNYSIDMVNTIYKMGYLTKKEHKVFLLKLKNPASPAEHDRTIQKVWDEVDKCEMAGKLKHKPFKGYEPENLAM